MACKRSVQVLHRRSCSLDQLREKKRYNHYGCWCGPGGSGKPIDGIDTCCMHHDLCYDEAVKSGVCSKIGSYLRHYGWDCVKERNEKHAKCRGE
ncbi:unnamed protein product [Cylicocyclus nassatus]|uniref:Phospholipase A2 n=1 Tax=Cylicocyclus nassatus TaxID=53992 RepID=A0AA36H6F3_CYLNA|nr:unnamed protein product [Cylicocyclus nassatus]